MHYINSGRQPTRYGLLLLKKTGFFRNVTLGLLLGGPLWAQQKTFGFNNRLDMPLVSQRLLLSRKKALLLEGNYSPKGVTFLWINNIIL
jgi:hypothetical protein